MAARLTRRQADTTRAAISATRIVQRLQQHIEGECELTGSQVNAALGLLSYALPKPQQQVEQTGELVVRWQS